ncbi:basic salivary proline-rich protein 3-like isoform X1 [Corapipo altera]|uniref:basic salivary proline-rich protein 3-like isoform X1 n=1 Tax=Corapipo altera TaxID=415028 RepID=UPI000FD667AF|nr:basic salivary proline-rich protein 3-like isoform X1 [Corapipo altera]XP_027521341.1 basic salivary proline-rich protein 3-like isoform X1 [Corapipo altera]
MRVQITKDKKKKKKGEREGDREQWGRRGGSPRRAWPPPAPRQAGGGGGGGRGGRRGGGSGRGLRGESPWRSGAASDHPRPPPRPPRRAPGRPCAAATGPPSGRCNPRGKQKFGVPPRPSPPRSPPGAGDEGAGSKPPGVTPAGPGVTSAASGGRQDCGSLLPLGALARGGGAGAAPAVSPLPQAGGERTPCLRCPPLPRTPRLPPPPPPPPPPAALR